MIEETEKIGYYDIIHIIFENKHYKLLMDYRYDKPMTFKDVLDYAKKRGYKKGVLMLLADQELEGEGWLYNNYPKTWYKYCVTKGYA